MTDTVKSLGLQRRRQRDLGSPAPNDWKLTIEIGPDLLYVKLRSQQQASSADLQTQFQKLLDQHLDDNIVLELDEIPMLDAQLIHALVEWHGQIHARGGIMRISGLDPRNERILRRAGLEDRFPRYVNRGVDGMSGEKPRKPR